MNEQRALDLVIAYWCDHDRGAIGPLSDAVEELGYPDHAALIRQGDGVLCCMPHELLRRCNAAITAEFARRDRLAMGATP